MFGGLTITGGNLGKSLSSFAEIGTYGVGPFGVHERIGQGELPSLDPGSDKFDPQVRAGIKQNDRKSMKPSHLNNKNIRSYRTK